MDVFAPFNNVGTCRITPNSPPSAFVSSNLPNTYTLGSCYCLFGFTLTEINRDFFILTSVTRLTRRFHMIRHTGNMSLCACICLVTVGLQEFKEESHSQSWGVADKSPCLHKRTQGKALLERVLGLWAENQVAGPA